MKCQIQQYTASNQTLISQIRHQCHHRDYIYTKLLWIMFSIENILSTYMHEHQNHYANIFNKHSNVCMKYSTALKDHIFIYLN